MVLGGRPYSEVHDLFILSDSVSITKKLILTRELEFGETCDLSTLCLHNREGELFHINIKFTNI